MRKESFDIFEKSSETFMVVILNETPYPFFAFKIKNVKVDGKNYLAFRHTDPNIVLALSTNPRIYGISITSEKKRGIRFYGKGLVSKDEEILKLFESKKETDFVVLFEIENFEEEEVR